MKKPDIRFHRPRLLVALSVLGAIVILGGSGPPAAWAGTGVELSFDDGPDGSDDDGTDENYYPLRNGSQEGTTNDPFPGGGPQLVIELNGTAHRTDYGVGKYGRGIELEGASTDAISVTNLYPTYKTPHLYAFWALYDEIGVFWEETCRFKVGIDPSGELYVTVFNANCIAAPKKLSGLSWPSDSDFHHLQIHWDNYTMGQHYFDLAIDWNPMLAASVNTADLPTGPPSAVYFGRGIDGLVDELVATNVGPSVNTRFDYHELDCGANPDPNTTCSEYIAKALKDDLDTVAWDLPVRYKVIYDQTACPVTACRVVFAVGGGGTCPDDYPLVNDDVLNTIIAQPSTQPSGSRLAVVVVDPICWTPGFPRYPDEATQLLAVKADLVANHSTLFDLTEYYATGCSHGADLMLDWAVLNTAKPVNDRPKRIFVRSVADHGESIHCDYHTQWCGVKESAYDLARFSDGGTEGCEGVDPVWPHPEGSQCVMDFFAAPEQDPFIDLVTDAHVDPGQQALEVGRSWGRNDPPPEDPVCNLDFSPSLILCSEEGGLAATDGGRQFRDKWREIEDTLQLSPATGYFIENATSDCAHCSLDENQVPCLAEYLEGGRSQLSPPCLAWDLDPGVPVADCSLYP